MSSRGERLIPRDWRFLVTNLFMSALLMHHVTFPSVYHITLSLSFARRLSIVVTLCPVRRLNSKLVKWIGNRGNRGEILSRARTPTNVANPEKCYICEFFFIAGPQVNKIRGTKTQNFPGSNFLRAKTFRTKCAKPFLTTSLKSALLPLTTLPKSE